MTKHSDAKLMVEGLYEIIPLKPLRHTPGVWFDMLPEKIVAHTSGVDRVIHEKGANSPGPVGSIQRPWYMHPSQEDHLLVLHGAREVELYTRAHESIEKLRVMPERVERNGEYLHEGACLVKWYRNVFHRIQSDAVAGSASLNFAIRFEGFDIATNFSIYDLNTETGAFSVIRPGHLDQLANLG